ncbi:MAG: HAD family hydrolase [Bdellovibrio sp. CG10_big_fil_rev_8_21_14_0_10_47_8]|nr:MAG: HAD family hydrolase [Bdellovibrio sp. CG10_big_fil_rev_8_21_14_0_10_47_8]
MKSLSEFKSRIDFVFTDIDDTLTDEGRLGSEAYQAMWKLSQAGIQVIPVTGRPAGWCEMIARVWPVAGVIGENGGFYFRYTNRSMERVFVHDFDVQIENRKKLDRIQEEILTKVPGSSVASDQFCRFMDLAIDFCEDVPRLPQKEVDKIVAIFESHGAQAKVSSIHVNGWFGNYDKLTMTKKFLEKEFSVSVNDAKKRCCFCGDSPNDEPMFEFFPESFAVANINEFLPRLKHQPTYVAQKRGGLGFTEIAEKILSQR